MVDPFLSTLPNAPGQIAEGYDGDDVKHELADPVRRRRGHHCHHAAQHTRQTGSNDEGEAMTVVPPFGRRQPADDQQRFSQHGREEDRRQNRRGSAPTG